MHPVIALDIGTAPAALVAGGTWEHPFLCREENGSAAVRRWSRWSHDVAETILAWKARWPEATIWRELTFQAKFNVGQSQAEKAADLAEAGLLFCVDPVSELEAKAAWQMLGCPALGQGDAGRHVRDGCGVAMKAIIITRKAGVDLFDYTPYMAQQRFREERRRGKARARR